MKYRKKFTPIEAILWTGNNLEEVVALTDEDHLCIITNPHAPECSYQSYKMMEELGYHEPIHHLLVGSEKLEIYENQYIIKDEYDRYSELAKDIFEDEYEAV